MKMYVVRKYHGHSSWIDPKHLIVEIYQREVIE